LLDRDLIRHRADARPDERLRFGAMSFFSAGAAFIVFTLMSSVLA
jgi:hypothetical protein